ncbi:MAG TPA: sulfatase-like hydrolase/transferase, partial [bacterium]|nr:sulfatase-like hydrolase/transferase [bacterium]
MNVVLITLDTLRADHLSCYGYQRQTSPNLDRFAAKGVRFKNAFCTIPCTLPSHASIMTGLHPYSLSLGNNNTHLTTEVSTLAEVLKAQGYTTAAFVSSFVLAPETNISQGFGVYDATNDFVVEVLDRSSNVYPGRRHALQTTRRAVEWLRNHTTATQQPFFLWVHYYDPHFPYVPPPEFDRFGTFAQSGTCDLYRRLESKEISMSDVFSIESGVVSDKEIERGIDLYDAAILSMDYSLGILLDALHGSLSNTIFLIVGDHGESLGEHGPVFCHFLLDDPCVRVPLIVVSEGRLPQGQERDDLCSTLDILPTLLSLLRVGQSSLPDSVERSGRDLFAEPIIPPRAVFADDGVKLFMVRTLFSKTLLTEDGNVMTFFDLVASPDEGRFSDPMQSSHDEE